MSSTQSGVARAQAAAPLASPAVRQLAREQGIDLTALAARLGKSYLAESDLAAAAGANAAANAAARGAGDTPDRDSLGPGEAQPLSRLEKLAGANLLDSHQRIPTVTHHDALDTGAVEALRAALADEAATRGLRLSALSLHALALARSLAAFPRFNAALTDGGESLWLKRDIHIGIAVDTPHGLMVPVLRNADRIGLWEIAAGIADLAARARQRKLDPSEMRGAGMSISSLGGIGGRGFTPMINPPVVAILGITRTRTEAVWDGGQFQPRQLCPLDLSYDHRVINGADAARFMGHYIGLLESPRKLLF